MLNIPQAANFTAERVQAAKDRAILKHEVYMTHVVKEVKLKTLRRYLMTVPMHSSLLLRLGSIPA